MEYQLNGTMKFKFPVAGEFKSLILIYKHLYIWTVQSTSNSFK